MHFGEGLAPQPARSALVLLLAIALVAAVAGCGSKGRGPLSRTTSGGEHGRPSSSTTSERGRAVIHCSRVASLGGAIGTPERLVRSLRPGQVGCLRAGVYSMDREVIVQTPNVTLASYPGERAAWDGRIVILASGVTIEGLNLDGTLGPPSVPPESPQCQAIGGCTLPSLSINGPRARIYGNDITNGRGICVNTRVYDGMTPNDFDIQRNRIHDCKPADNHNHGIYIADGANGLIKNNVIYDNGDRGIQLYPNATHVTVVWNTVDGNRTGLELGANASDNIIERNIFSFPSTSQSDPSAGLGPRFNVEAHLDVSSAGGNIVRDNCIYTAATGYFGSSPPHSGIATEQGVVASQNTVAPPTYVNHAAHNFTLAKRSACVGFGAAPDVTTP